MARMCRGSGVPGDWFEHGHSILPGTEQLVFATMGRRQQSGLLQFRPRCRLCNSTRGYWKRDRDAMAKATQAHRRHADRMVSKGFYPDRVTAVQMMNGAGCTVAWLADTILNALGKPCPGLCFEPAVVNGRPDAQPHIITRTGDIQLDWRDPRFPMTPENAGILEGTCNQQKQGKPWAEFMAIQHAIRQNFLHGKLADVQATLF